MIDEEAFNAAASVYRRKIKYRGWALDMALYAAIDAYLAAAPSPGTYEPAGYIDGPRFDGETGKVREGGAHLFSSGRGLLHPVPLFTAAPLPGTEPVTWDARHPKIRALSDGGQKND